MESYLSSYLRATWRVLACFALCMLAMHVVLFLSVPLRPAWSELGYLDLLLCAMALGFYGFGFAHYRSRHRRLARALAAGEPLLSALEGAPPAEDIRFLCRCIAAEDARFEAQRGRLEADLRAQRELLASWAHEVKTPLSVCRLILSREEAGPVRRPMEQQLTRIEQQLKSALHAERLRHLDQSLLMKRLDVHALIRAAIARCAPLLQARSLEVDLEVEPGAEAGAQSIEAMGDEQCVAYVLDQLLTNAAKYAPEGSTVRITAARAGQAAQVAVINLGEIPSHQIGRVFDKGFSGGDERASGMGLFYARQTATALGGDLLVRAEGGEVAFQVSLPRFQQHLRPAAT